MRASPSRIEDDAAAHAIVGVAGLEQMHGSSWRGDATPSRRAGFRRCRQHGCCDTRRQPQPCPEATMTLDAHADLVLTGGRVATMDAARRWASALAVRDGRIVAVGSDTAVRLAIGAADPGHRAARSDRHAGVPGRARAPGRRPASRCSACDLARAPRSATSTSPIIAAYARSHPDEPWIRGGGWYMATFERGAPRREDLDRIVPDRPVVPEQPRRPQRLGQRAGPRARRRDCRDPGPARRPDRARSRRDARAARSTRARWTSSSGSRPGGLADGPRRRRYGSPSATSTRSASPPGRTRSSTATRRSSPTSRSPSAAS